MGCKTQQGTPIVQGVPLPCCPSGRLRIHLTLPCSLSAVGWERKFNSSIRLVCVCVAITNTSAKHPILHLGANFYSRSNASWYPYFFWVPRQAHINSRTPAERLCTHRILKTSSRLEFNFECSFARAPQPACNCCFGFECYKSVVAHRVRARV